MDIRGDQPKGQSFDGKSRSESSVRKTTSPAFRGGAEVLHHRMHVDCAKHELADGHPQWKLIRRRFRSVNYHFSKPKVGELFTTYPDEGPTTKDRHFANARMISDTENVSKIRFRRGWTKGGKTFRNSAWETENRNQKPDDSARGDWANGAQRHSGARFKSRQARGRTKKHSTIGRRRRRRAAVWAKRKQPHPLASWGLARGFFHNNRGRDRKGKPPNIGDENREPNQLQHHHRGRDTSGHRARIFPTTPQSQSALSTMGNTAQQVPEICWPPEALYEACPVHGQVT